MNFKVLTSLTVILFAACSTDTNLPLPSFEQAEAQGFVADNWKTLGGTKIERITYRG